MISPDAPNEVSGAAVPLLLVDDNPSKLLSLQAILEDSDLNLDIHTAKSGAQALQRLLDSDYALILMDVNMPDMDGFETTRTIRMRRRSKNIPVIFVTAETHADAAIYGGYALGAVDFITSPLVPELLIAKVRVFISLWQMRAELENTNNSLSRELVEHKRKTELLADANLELQRSRDELVEVTRLATVNEMASEVARDLTELIDTANVPIIGVALDGTVTDWNRAAERLTGYTRDDLVDTLPINLLVPDAYRRRMLVLFARAARDIPSENEQVTLRTKDGRYLTLVYNCTARHASNGVVVGITGVAQDLTELRDTQAQLIQTSKLASLGEMSTGVAHELNQPLNVIRMAAANIRGRVDAGHDVETSYLQNKLGRIEKQTVRASAIIDHMRMFGRTAVEPAQPIDVRTTVESAVEMVSEQLRLNDIQVVTNFETCPPILGHPIPLEQVIINLIHNARDAYQSQDAEAKASGQSTIRIAVDVLADQVRIRVIDQAGGFPGQTVERIFEPFFTTKEVGEGTGLGLSVSYGIVSEFGGTISARNLDGGACMTILLPPCQMTDLATTAAVS